MLQREDIRTAAEVLTPLILALVSWWQKRRLDAIHVLVNSDHAMALRLAATALRRVADLTKLPEDVTAARIAEAASQAHESKSK